MNWYFQAWKQSFVYSGRAHRKEYWIFTIINILMVFALASINLSLDSEFPFLAIIYLIASLFPSISLLVRRLHDIGKSGWLALFALVPYLGGVIVLIFALIPSESGDNVFGPSTITSGS